jgi:hypothetical protein
LDDLFGSIFKAEKDLGYEPRFDILAGISKAMPWYVNKLK